MELFGSIQYRGNKIYLNRKRLLETGAWAWAQESTGFDKGDEENARRLLADPVQPLMSLDVARIVWVGARRDVGRLVRSSLRVRKLGHDRLLRLRTRGAGILSRMPTAVVERPHVSLDLGSVHHGSRVRQHGRQRNVRREVRRRMPGSFGRPLCRSERQFLSILLHDADGRAQYGVRPVHHRAFWVERSEAPEQHVLPMRVRSRFHHLPRRPDLLVWSGEREMRRLPAGESDGPRLRKLVPVGTHRLLSVGCR